MEKSETTNGLSQLLFMKSENKTKQYENTDSPNTRLGICEVCANDEAKYTCPKCEVKTCRLQCLTIHKKELNCDGIRDKTKYIPIKKMTTMDYMNDYRFLEECTRYVENRKRDPIKAFTAFNKPLPFHLKKLRSAAEKRKTTLRFLLPNFTRHKSNTTTFNEKLEKIFWRIEWNFVNVDDGVIVDEKCDEDLSLGDLLCKYFDPKEDETPKSLIFYKSRGLSGVKVLLKSEEVKRCNKRFWELDLKKSLKENLVKKTIIEHPFIYILFKELETEFDLIDSDNEEDYKFNSKEASIKSEPKSELKTPLKFMKTEQSDESTSNNFLFTDECFWVSSDSDDDDEEKEKKRKLNHSKT